MTYTSGGLIQATDYNGFVNDTAGANVNNVWSTGSVDAGWGQPALSTVSATNTITATQWATLVNTLVNMGGQTNTTITSRTAPTAGQTIGILAALNTDLTNITNNRLNAAANGTQFTGWTGTNSKTAATSGSPWSITFTNTVTWASADAARYFFNAGGRIKIDVSKTSNDNATGDPEWNDLANNLCGDIFITGGTATQTIAGTAYTGTTRIGGSASPNILLTTTGWYDLTAGAAATIVYKQFADTAPYTNNFIQHSIAKNAGSTALTITTLWSASDGDPITGGTAASGATPGTAPCTIVTYFPPSSTYLSTTSWGTPTVAATTA
jgi:hypothetical protein